MTLFHCNIIKLLLFYFIYLEKLFVSFILIYNYRVNVLYTTFNYSYAQNTEVHSAQNHILYSHFINVMCIYSWYVMCVALNLPLLLSASVYISCYSSQYFKYTQPQHPTKAITYHAMYSVFTDLINHVNCMHKIMLGLYV